MDQSNCGSSYWSWSLIPNVQNWSSGPKMRTMSSRSYSLQMLPGCGEKRKTNPLWTTRSWAVVSDTTMAIQWSRRFMEKDMYTGFCVTSQKFLAMIQWLSNVKTLWMMQCVEKQLCHLKSMICMLLLQLKVAYLLDILTSVCFVVKFFCWDPKRYVTFSCVTSVMFFVACIKQIMWQLATLFYKSHRFNPCKFWDLNCTVSLWNPLGKRNEQDCTVFFSQDLYFMHTVYAPMQINSKNGTHSRQKICVNMNKEKSFVFSDPS